MALRGIKPQAVPKRFKGFWFGPAGSGKTFAAIQFPRPYLIDAERGAENPQYVEALEKAGGAYFFTTDLREIIVEVQALATTQHEYRTLVIDPMTVPYNNACDEAARALAAQAKDPHSDGTEFGRHKARADREMKRLTGLLLQLDMNVIVTAHSKTKWEKVGNDFREAGQTFDCFSKLDYLFDLGIELQRRGSERKGIVRKSRIMEFPEGDVFDFGYPEIAKRLGAEVMERKAETIALATPEQAARIRHLVGLLNISEEVTGKWLSKANAEEFEDIPAAAAGKILAWLDARIAVEPKPAEGGGQ